jgi:antitoxin component YwqK of YwqJK toxin-antitoxin module
MQGDYANDLLEGEVIYYSEKGQITKIEVYESGKLISTRQPNE